MRTRIALLGAGVLTATLAACGCGTGDAAKPAPADQPANPGAGQTAPAKPATAAAVKVAQTDLGPILTDQDGRTLYGFTNDKDGASSCTADCIATWPALTSGKPVAAGPGTTATLLKQTSRTEGTNQATYNDWPLYYYVGDTAPGDINGQGVDGVWFAVAPDGKLVRTAA